MQKKTRLLTIHGGPGLSSSYLKKPLLEFSSEFEFEFYDQAIVSSTSTPLERLDNLVSQLLEQFDIIRKDGELGIFAHSWGTFLLLEALKRDPTLIDRSSLTILVSPFPLDTKRLGEMAGRLMDRIPDNVKQEVDDLTKKGDGVEVMKAYAPYYFKNKNNAKKLNHTFYSAEQNQLLFESAATFDHSKIASKYSAQLLTILGDDDFITVNDICELEHKNTIQIIKDCGHYPFIEKPNKFREYILNK